MALGNKEVMARNIQYYLDKNGLERNALCEALGFKYSTVSEWIQGKKYPRIDKIEMMANFFHIKKSDLVEEHNAIPEYVPEIQELVDLLPKLTPEQRDSVLQMARLFVRQNV